MTFYTIKNIIREGEHVLFRPKKLRYFKYFKHGCENWKMFTLRKKTFEDNVLYIYYTSFLRLSSSWESSSSSS